MRPRFTNCLAILVITLLSLTSGLQAQQGSFMGQGTDENTGQPLAPAQILVVGGGSSGGALTDAQGNFTLSVASGSYSIVSVLIGYETARIDGISVGAGATEEVSVEMVSTALSLAPVSVTAGTKFQPDTTLTIGGT